jgi:hypothetical protein
MSEGGRNMDGYDVVTAEDEKVGTVVGETGAYLIVEHGTLRKSKQAVPREFATVDTGEQQVRITVSKNVFYDSPKLNGEFDEQAVAEHYGLAASSAAPGTEGLGVTDQGDPSRSSEEQALRDGVMPAAQERAQIREGARDDAALPAESPGLLGDRVPKEGDR